MIRDLRRNEKGLIFIVVLMIVIVMMTLTVSLLGVNITQSYLTEGEYRRTRAELVSSSAMFAAMAARFANASVNNLVLNETIDGQTYTANATFTGPANAAALNVVINY